MQSAKEPRPSPSTLLQNKKKAWKTTNQTALFRANTVSKKRFACQLSSLISQIFQIILFFFCCFSTSNSMSPLLRNTKQKKHAKVNNNKTKNNNKRGRHIHRSHRHKPHVSELRPGIHELQAQESGQDRLRLVIPPCDRTTEGPCYSSFSLFFIFCVCFVWFLVPAIIGRQRALKQLVASRAHIASARVLYVASPGCECPLNNLPTLTEVTKTCLAVAKEERD